MSGDGYAEPDTHDFCYIGFVGGSAALSQTIPAEYTGSPQPYYLWLQRFFNNALTNDWTVKHALDVASGVTYNADFGQIDLHTGFLASWPMYRNGEWTYEGYEFEGWMKVYGNSNVKLYQQTLTLSANGGFSPTFTLDGQSQGIGTYNLVAKSYRVSVNDMAGYTFSHFSYKNQRYYSRPIPIKIDSSGELKANYNCTLTTSVNCPLMGSTTPSGNPQYLKNTYAQVKANPNSGYVLDYWKKDGSENLGNTPTINVWMDQSHTLQAIFTTAPPYKFVSEVTDYGGYYVDSPENVAGWEPDEHLAIMAGPPNQPSWIIGEMSAQATGHIEVYGCYQQSYPGNIEVYVYSEGSGWEFFSSTPVTSTTAYWIDCGTYAGTFECIALQTSDWYTILEVDSVKVTA
jgi:hypothetical protein